MAKRQVNRNTRPKAKPLASTSKITPKRVFILTLSLGALGGAIYLLREYYLKHKADQSSDQTPTPSASQRSSNSSSTGDGFPLKKGSTGTRVTQLQEALSSLLGQNTMVQNGGIDGSFGKGTENALKLAGYGKTVSQALFNQIVKNEPTIIFNPQDLAEKLYHSAQAQSSTGVLEVLRQIKDVSQYSALNQAYKKMGFISKTIVTHLLDQSFAYDSGTKEKIKSEFLRMGLKLDQESEQWSLSGFTAFRDIITIVDTYVVDEKQNHIRVSKNTILGDEQEVENGMTLFKSIDNSYGRVPTEHVKYV